MKISSEILEGLSAKDKGYIEAAAKYIEASRLLEEARNEFAHLRGHADKQAKGLVNPGGKIIDVSKPGKPEKASPVSREDALPKMLSLLRQGPQGTRALAQGVGCSPSNVRTCLVGTQGVRRVGGGAQTVWTLNAPKGPKGPKGPKKHSAKASKARVKKHLPKRNLTNEQRSALVLQSVKSRAGFASITGIIEDTRIEFVHVKALLLQLKKEGKVVQEVNTQKGKSARMYWVVR